MQLAGLTTERNTGTTTGWLQADATIRVSVDLGVGRQIVFVEYLATTSIQGLDTLDSACAIHSLSTNITIFGKPVEGKISEHATDWPTLHTYFIT
jgi:hypothetical protein